MQNHILRSALMIVTLVAACDHTPTIVDFRYLPGIGDVWSDGDKGCDNGVFYKSEAGAMCLAGCGFPECGGVQVDECGHKVGQESACITAAECAFTCTSGLDCIDGQRCDSERHICVWESMPASTVPPKLLPGPYSLCAGSKYQCEGTCIKTSGLGEICASACQNNADCALPNVPNNECSEPAPTACDEGQCKIPCDDFGGCWGLDAYVCSEDLWVCLARY